VVLVLLAVEDEVVLLEELQLALSEFLDLV
jgi:hypothetical protein